MTTAPDQNALDAFLAQWAAAECDGDIESLEALLADDFYGVGPLGFVLPRPAWLDRHRHGLVYDAFDLDEIQVHLLHEAALVTARNTTLGIYRGQHLPEALRATLVLAAASTGWRLAAIHMSFIAGTRGAPPLPGSTNPPAQRGETGARP